MKVVNLQQPTQHPVYRITEFNSILDFQNWLYNLLEEDISVLINKQRYHFGTRAERLQFIIGMNFVLFNQGD